ncbi:hypothetical protein GRAN_2238 [Granulicella sibirica]|uniref:Uncharacterized protein n=1 Tax=Granulicella sibirica TaxID=2479048 RepID=A0A4Q0T9Y2_9BACT|nr:hypothetical protein GRAN_2238 [Granulicella sibirica]
MHAAPAKGDFKTRRKSYLVFGAMSSKRDKERPRYGATIAVALALVSLVVISEGNLRL